jgi:hypothetical protein
MITYENECCECSTPAYPCIGEYCSKRRVPHYYCDLCGEEIFIGGMEDQSYEYNECHYHKDCLLSKLVSDEVIKML